MGSALIDLVIKIGVPLFLGWTVLPLAVGTLIGRRLPAGLRNLAFLPLAAGLYGLSWLLWARISGFWAVEPTRFGGFWLFSAVSVLIRAQTGQIRPFLAEIRTNPALFSGESLQTHFQPALGPYLGSEGLYWPFLALGLALGGLWAIVSPLFRINHQAGTSPGSTSVRTTPTDRPTIPGIPSPKGKGSKAGQTDDGGMEKIPEPWESLRPWGYRFRIGSYTVWRVPREARSRVKQFGEGKPAAAGVFPAFWDGLGKREPRIVYFALQKGVEKVRERGLEKIGYGTLPRYTVTRHKGGIDPLYRVLAAACHQGRMAPAGLSAEQLTRDSESWLLTQRSSKHPTTWARSYPLGAVTLTAAPPKVGKSTLTAGRLRAQAGGATLYLGRPLTPGRAIVLSEESPGLSCYDPPVSGTPLSGSTLPIAPGNGPPSLSVPLNSRHAPAALPPLPPLTPLVKSGPGTVRSLALLPWHLAQAAWCARVLTRADPSLPCRTIVLDSLFHWCPEAETDTGAAKAALATLRALATLPPELGGPFAVEVLAHTDPDTGRLKGPQQLWAQADYRTDIRQVPKSSPPQQTARRLATFTGRFPPDQPAPPPLAYRLLPSGDILPDGPPEAAQETGDEAAGLPAEAPQDQQNGPQAGPHVPSFTHPRLAEVLALLPQNHEPPQTLPDLTKRAAVLPLPVSRSVLAAVLASASDPKHGQPSAERVEQAGPRGTIAYRRAR